ncbi:MAG: hypothetical protein CL758_06055 [Chloroflexi bacterium]|nr:hypothetical protein [Chloroflexota bacterium]
MKISLIQMNSGEKNTRDNVAKACDFINEAAKDSPDLIVTPEYFNTGYFPMYRDFKNYSKAERDDGPTITAMIDKAKQHKTHIAATIIEEDAMGVFYNSTILINENGSIVGKYRKMHPPANSSLEKIYYRNGGNFRTFKIKDFNVSFLICADFYFPEAPRCAVLNGADLIIVPFCEVGYYTSPNVSNKPDDIVTGSQKKNFDSGQRRLLWNSLSMIRAYENACYVAPCNHIGYEFESYMAGGSLICDPTGKIIIQAEDKEMIISSELNRAILRKARNNSMLKDRRPDLYDIITTPMEDLLLP